MSRVYQRNLAEHLERWRFVRDARTPWDTEARIDRDYEAGKFWTPTELLSFRGRQQPATRYPILRPTINLVCGLEAMNRSDLKVLPRVPSQIQAAAARTKLTKYVQDVTHLDRHFSLGFRESSIVGVGWVEPSFNNNPAAACRIKAARIPSDYVYTDPAGIEPDLSDHLDWFRALWMRGEDLARLFPKFRREILAMCGLRESDSRSIESWSHSSDLSNFNGGNPPLFTGYANGANHGQQLDDHDMIDRHRGQVQAVERWYRCYEAQDYVRFRDGRVVVLTEENAMQIAAAIESGDAAWPETGVFCNIHVAIFAGDLLLHEGPSPYRHGRFPGVPLWAYTDENGRPCGLVRMARDTAKEYNARKTSILRKVLQTQFWVETGTFPNLDRARRALMANESLIEVAAGALAAGRIQAVDKTATLESEEKAAAENLELVKNITGVQPELLGMAQNADSGVAIEKLQNQGEIGLYTLFDNRNWALLTVGEMLQSMISDCFTEEMAVRVNDGAAGLSFLMVNQQMPDGTVQNDLSQDGCDVALALDAKSQTSMVTQLREINAYLANAPEEIKIAFAPELARLAALPNSQETIPMLEKLSAALLQRILGAGAPAAGPQVPPGAAGPPAPSVQQAPLTPAAPSVQPAPSAPPVQPAA